MGRGKTAQDGATRVAKNGYHYTKMSSHPRASNGWILTHWLTAEKKLGRPLKDNEMVQFVDSKYKSDPENLAGVRIVVKKTASLRRRKAVIEDRIRELQAELTQIEKELAKVD
jgi:hypothetical protein